MDIDPVKGLTTKDKLNTKHDSCLQKSDKRVQQAGKRHEEEETGLMERWESLMTHRT